MNPSDKIMDMVCTDAVEMTEESDSINVATLRDRLREAEECLTKLRNLEAIPLVVALRIGKLIDAYFAKWGEK